MLKVVTDEVVNSVLEAMSKGVQKGISTEMAQAMAGETGAKILDNSNALAQAAVKELGAGPQEQKLTDFEKQLKEVHETNEMPAGSPLGQKFAAMVRSDPDLQNMYKQTPGGNPGKEAFRVRWAQQKYKEMVEKKMYSQSFQHIEKEKGTYYSFERIVVEEGGWVKSNIVAALNYGGACVAMQGVWTKFNRMTKRLEYLYIKKTYIDEFSEKWELAQ